MTETLPRGVGRRRGREARLLTAGVLVCGAVLLPAASAFAEDMPAMKDGMMCPHAVGDASNPATAAPPTRNAPNEAPLGAKPSSVVVTKPAAGQASAPASKAPAERATSTQPAGAGAGTTARSGASAGAVAVRTQPALTPVAQRAAVSAPVARPSTTPAPRAHARTQVTRSAPAARVVAPRVVTTVIPEVTRPSAGNAPQIAAAPATSSRTGVAWQAIGAALVLLAIAATAFVARRRRGSGGAPIAAIADGPQGPSAMTFDEVEFALRDLLARSRGRDLLVDAEGDADAATAPVGVLVR
jgi:hypothetical protein